MLQVYLNLLDTQEDKEKFEQLYALYKDKMYKVAYQILHNRHDAEDAVHDSVIAIIDNLEKIKEINCHETWNYIVTIVKSRALTSIKEKENVLNGKLRSRTTGTIHVNSRKVRKTHIFIKM